MDIGELRCFWCVVEKVQKQEYGDKDNVVTIWQGTPVCAIHAYKLAEGQVTIAKTAW